MTDSNQHSEPAHRLSVGDLLRDIEGWLPHEWESTARVKLYELAGRARKAESLLEQLEAARRDADQLGEQADLQGEECQRLREQLEALRVVLDTAYRYYPKGTPMSESMRDVLYPASRSSDA